MISRCNEVRANNSCRELLVLEPVLRKLSIGTKVHRAKGLNLLKWLDLAQGYLLLSWYPVRTGQKIKPKYLRRVHWSYA